MLSGRLGCRSKFFSIVEGRWAWVGQLLAQKKKTRNTYIWQEEIRFLVPALKGQGWIIYFVVGACRQNFKLNVSQVVGQNLKFGICYELLKTDTSLRTPGNEGRNSLRYCWDQARWTWHRVWSSTQLSRMADDSEGKPTGPLQHGLCEQGHTYRTELDESAFV